MRSPGRWQRVLLDALTNAELVGVGHSRHHLGRRVTRSELTAAGRTAAHLAAYGRVTLHQVRVQPGQDAGGGVFLVIARPGAEVNDNRLRQATRGRTPAASDPAAAEQERQATAHHATQAVAALEQAAADARTVDVDHLTPEQAAQLAGQLGVALAEVTALQRQLTDAAGLGGRCSPPSPGQQRSRGDRTSRSNWWGGAVAEGPAIRHPTDHSPRLGSA